MIGIRKENREFVAAKSGDKIACAEVLPQDVCERHQRTVSLRMPELVVDGFEVVQIQKCQGDREARSTRHGEQKGPVFMERSAIAQTCQIILST